MKLTTQEEYGLRCLLQLARPDVPGSLTIPELGKREGISAANVAKIMRVLRKAGFVRSTRGQSGGYALARAAEQIVVSDVIARLGGPLYDASFCQRGSVGSLRNATETAPLTSVFAFFAAAASTVAEAAPELVSVSFGFQPRRCAYFRAWRATLAFANSANTVAPEMRRSETWACASVVVASYGSAATTFTFERWMPRRSPARSS